MSDSRDNPVSPFSAEIEAQVCQRVTNAHVRHGLDTPAPAHPHGHGGIAEVLDLDAQIMAEHTAAVVAGLPVTGAVHRIADLGAGTGAGTFALLAQFPDAHVVAVDSSTEHLDQLRFTAAQTGLAERIDTVNADLDREIPPLGEPDLVWASASLHHLTDPQRALRRVGEAMHPDGLLVVVEVDGFPRFLPDDAPADRPGVEARCHEASNRQHRAQMPHRGADFGPVLRAAGFTVERREVLDIAVPQAAAPALGRYAAIGLERMREVLTDELAPEDLAALDRLLDPGHPESLLQRTDLTLRTTRTVWTARHSGQRS